MSSAEEGGATANATSFPYGGGGAGGKFRKKPFRRQTTPYDRPPTALHGSNNNNNNSNNSSWLTKLVVEPASKLISYGADRFFASVLRRRLPPQLPEVNADVIDVDQGAGGLNLKAQDDAPEPRASDCSQPINSSSCNVVVELEQLLKQKAFTRSEIVHLTELLQSRAVEVSLEDVSQKEEENASDFGTQQQFASGLSEGNLNGLIRSTAIVSTPAHNSKVLVDDIASPAELAKAYMGSRPSKVSPSVLGMRSQLGKEDAGLLTSMVFASKSPIMPSTKNTPVRLGAPENGFVTPRSRSRSALYNMARTPYSRVHPTSILKGSGINNNGYAGPSASSSSLSPVEYNENFLSQPLTLKRRSSALDDEGGSVGPMRRIRQKSNLLAPRFHHTSHGVQIGSHTKQKPELIGEQKSMDLKNIGEIENESVPSTSYARVPSKSSEVAARILQNLEKLSPKEKPSESKLVAAWQKSPLKSTPSMLSRQVPRSMEDVGSSKLLLDVQDNHKFGDKTSTLLPDARDSSLQKQGKAEGNDPKASVGPSTWNSVLYNDSAVSLKASTPGIETSNFVVKNGASQPPQKKRAFRMSAEEDSLEQDDVQCNGLVSRSLSEKKGPLEFPLANSNRAPAAEFKIGQTAIEPEEKLPLDIFRRTSELSPGSIKVGERTSAVQASSEETMAAKQSETFASSVAVFDKTKEANNPPLFNFSSKVVDKFPSLPEEPIKRAEPELESSSRRDVISVSIGSEVKAPESENGFHLKFPKAGDINGRCDDVSSASSNGSLFPSFSPSSFLAASSRDTNQISTGSVPLFTSSASISSTPATSSGSIFGLDTKPSSLAAPTFNFGSSVVPSNAVSAASTAGISQFSDQRTTPELNPSSGSSNSSHSTVAAFAASSSGSSTFGLGSSVNFSTGSNLQDSLFASASKSLIPGVGAVPQASSNLLFSSASVPVSNTNASPSIGSTPSPTFGFTSSTSSLGPSSLVPVSGSTSSLFKFGASSTPVSEGSAPSFSTSPSPAGIFSFGLSSSSTSTSTVGSSSGGAPSMFNFGGTSSPASVINTGSSFSSGTSGIFNFGGSSSASTPTFNSVSSSSAPSTTFGSSWNSPNSAAFSSSSTGLAFAAPSTSNPIFPFATTSASASPVFTGGFAANNDQMNAEDSMAEDPAPSSTSVSVFGQPAVSPSPPGFMFGSTSPSPTSPFMFSGQQNQVAPQNPSSFQATGSLEFNAGGSFSLGSTGVGDKSGRKIVKINRSKNRKK